MGDGHLESVGNAGPKNNSAPLQKPYQDSRAAFHLLIVGRIYHEDMLFAQRSYVLLAVHAFLMTSFAILVTGQRSTLTWLGAVFLTLFGALLGIFQASFGRQTSRAIGFWREYLRIVEENWQIPFDHLQYDFYADARAETPFGVISKKKDSQKALYQRFGKARHLTSITTMVGLFFPVALAFFWALSLGYVLQQLTRCWSVGVLGFSALLIVGAVVLWPSLAEAASSTSHVERPSD